MTTDLVPFGKYKGQPVEALIADTDYCEWLAAQPWFRTRFQPIYQIIVNGPQQPAETPEHNEMQAWFLEDEPCLELARLVTKPGFIDRPVPQDPSPGPGFGPIAAPVILQAIRNHPGCFDLTRMEPYTERRRFEHKGWDVRFDVTTAGWEIVRMAEIPCVCPAGVRLDPEERPGPRIPDPATHRPPCLAEHQYLQSDRFDDRSSVVSLLVECKPTLGDDYPAVLRQVTGYPYDRYIDRRVVVVRDFSFERVEWDQVVEIFRVSGVNLVRMSNRPPPAIPAGSVGA